jgi:hypothetical protein
MLENNNGIISLIPVTVVVATQSPQQGCDVSETTHARDPEPAHSYHKLFTTDILLQAPNRSRRPWQDRGTLGSRLSIPATHITSTTSTKSSSPGKAPTLLKPHLPPMESLLSPPPPPMPPRPPHHKNIPHRHPHRSPGTQSRSKPRTCPQGSRCQSWGSFSSRHKTLAHTGQSP